MTKTETLRQTVKNRLQEEFNEGGSISQDTVHDFAGEEFEEMGGAEAFDIDEEDIFEFLVDEVIRGLTIGF